VGWAPLFLDYPDNGQTYRRLIHLMRGAMKADLVPLRPLAEGLALACACRTGADPGSALNSRWKRVPYTKSTLGGATAVWEGHRKATPAARKDPPGPSHFDSMFGGPGREEEGNAGWGDSWGYVLPNTPPPVVHARLGIGSAINDSRPGGESQQTTPSKTAMSVRTPAPQRPRGQCNGASAMSARTQAPQW
jgi:hypothetical protein